MRKRCRAQRARHACYDSRASRCSVADVVATVANGFVTILYLPVAFQLVLPRLVVGEDLFWIVATFFRNVASDPSDLAHRVRFHQRCPH